MDKPIFREDAAEHVRAACLDVPADIERRILACSEPALLSLWLTRAITAESAAEVVAPASS
jgi:hypothetical protein